MDCRPPGSSVLGISQARILEWVAISFCKSYILGSLVAQMVKRLPATQETRVRSPGWEDSLEKEMATHSTILALKIPWMEESGGLQSMGSQRFLY